MSEAAAPTYTIAANLRWFAAVYTTVLVCVAAIGEAAYRFGVELPTTGINIGAFIGVCAAAGQSFASKNGGSCTGSQRTQLALGYTAVSIVISFVLFGALMAFDPGTRAAVTDMINQSSGLMLVSLVVATLLFLAVARFTLAMLGRRGNT